MKILILGSEGMLGREILYQLSKSKKYQIYATCRGKNYLDKVDTSLFKPITKSNIETSSEILDILNRVKPDRVINCIGVIKQHGSKIPEHKYFFLNSSLPRIIESWCNLNKKKLIHFSTDCVFNGSKGGYGPEDTPDALDVYGLSKYLGEVRGKYSLTIRTSIIGFERNSNNGLLSWFLSNPENTFVNGYSNVMYSGLTTTYLAKIVCSYLLESNHYGLLQLGGPRISKYELLVLINNSFNAKILVKKYADISSDKTLCSNLAFSKLNITQPSWNDMIQHLKENSINFI